MGMPRNKFHNFCNTRGERSEGWKTASFLPDIRSCMMFALSASYGPLHAGVIEIAYKSLEKVGCVENAKAKIDSVKAGKE